MSEKTKRNTLITIAVLNGYTLKDVAGVANLSAPVVRTIVMNTCRKYARNIFEECGPNRFEKAKNIADLSRLRRRSNRIITILNENLK